MQRNLSYKALPDAVTRKEKYQLIFIDGWHTFDYTLVDFFYADLLLELGGFLVFDDVQLPAVAKVGHIFFCLIFFQRYIVQVVDYVRMNRRYVSRKEIYINAGRIRTEIFEKLSADDRDWDYHVPF